MKDKLPPRLKMNRIAGPNMPLPEDLDGMTGAYGWAINAQESILIIASDATGWEDTSNMQWDHVSVQIGNKDRDAETRLPTRDEMHMVKKLFWDDDEIVVEFWPPEATYVNVTDCLHLWSDQKNRIPLPPMIMMTGLDELGRPIRTKEELRNAKKITIPT